MPFAATWMDLEIIILPEVSQKEKDIPHDTTYMWNLKYDTNELIYKTERLTDTENRPVVAKRWGEGWIGIWGLADANSYIQDE